MLLSSTAAAAPVRPAAIGSSKPSDFVAHNGRVWFMATKTGLGRWIWSSTGSAASTVPVYNLRPGARDLTATNTKLYWKAAGTAAEALFVANDGDATPTKIELPSGGTFSTVGLLAVGDLVFFGACDGTAGCEPWVSDGSSIGTHPVSDVYPGSGGSGPAWFTRYGPFALFSADDGARGRELWISGGGGAALVKNIAPGADNSHPIPMGTVGGKAVVWAYDNANGTEPWVTDGNSPNTALLRNIEPENSC
jgi:ELWxxDGT repeat protein